MADRPMSELLEEMIRLGTELKTSYSPDRWQQHWDNQAQQIAQLVAERDAYAVDVARLHKENARLEERCCNLRAALGGAPREDPSQASRRAAAADYAHRAIAAFEED